MSAVGIDAGTDFARPLHGGPDEISRRLESLPASSYVWRLVILLSLGGCFEIYDLFLTGYIAPGLNRSGLLTTTTQAFFGFSGIGAFVAATFAGLFVGTFFLGFLADRFGRRAIFTYALLGYTAASVIMACQTTVRRACCCGASSPASASASRSSPSTPTSPNWCRAGCAAAPSRSTRR